MRTVFCSLLIGMFLSQPAASADSTRAEIDYLLTTMGNSDCTFIRNGKNYDAEEAEAHLRRKYKRGKRYASTTEKFIRNLASQSSMSKKPYLISCDGAGTIESGTWLAQLLAEYRAGLSVDPA